MKNILAYFSAIVFFLGLVFGAGKLIAEQKENAKKIEVVEKRIEKIADEGTKEIEDIKKDNTEIEKAIIEQKIEQKYIKEKVDEVNDNLKVLINEIRKEK